MFYIYKITNKINGKIYIGYTNDCRRRWAEHIKYNSCKYIHRALVKYGVNNFEFSTIDYAETKEQALHLEIYWIGHYKYNSNKQLYNLTDGGENPPNHLGRKRTKEQKENMSRAQKGKIFSSEAKKNMSKSSATKGKHLAEEIKQKIREKHLGRKMNLSEISRKKISDTHKGKRLTILQKQTISEKCRGENNKNSKFTDADIINIRNLWELGNKTQTAIAKQYGVKPNTINGIVNKVRWKHI